MSRSTDLWVGRTDDSAIPPRVRLRVFERFGGVCQCGCTRRIQAGEAWEADHIQALINGGKHEEANLQPLLREHHKIKTKADVKIKAKSARIRQKHLGITRPRTIRAWRRFDGSIVHASRNRT